MRFMWYAHGVKWWCEMLCLPLALHMSETQVTQSSGTNLIIPGSLCEEKILSDSVG